MLCIYLHLFSFHSLLPSLSLLPFSLPLSISLSLSRRGFMSALSSMVFQYLSSIQNLTTPLRTVFEEKLLVWTWAILEDINFLSVLNWQSYYFDFYIYKIATVCVCLCIILCQSSRLAIKNCDHWTMHNFMHACMCSRILTIYRYPSMGGGGPMYNMAIAHFL